MTGRVEWKQRRRDVDRGGGAAAGRRRKLASGWDAAAAFCCVQRGPAARGPRPSVRVARCRSASASRGGRGGRRGLVAGDRPPKDPEGRLSI
eukprot:9499910-Pyramimonas_sp.AAC.1